jgi:hypothetical protein
VPRASCSAEPSRSTLEIAEVDGHHIHLEPTSDSQPLEPSNGYHIIPKEVIATYAISRKLPLS